MYFYRWETEMLEILTWSLRELLSPLYLLCLKDFLRQSGSDHHRLTFRGENRVHNFARVENRPISCVGWKSASLPSGLYIVCQLTGCSCFPRQKTPNLISHPWSTLNRETFRALGCPLFAKSGNLPSISNSINYPRNFDDAQWTHQTQNIIEWESANSPGLEAFCPPCAFIQWLSPEIRISITLSIGTLQKSDIIFNNSLSSRRFAWTSKLIFSLSIFFTLSYIVWVRIVC